MDIYRHALMELTVIDGEVVCTDGRPFDRVAYSRFKYGYVPPAIEYGSRLAHLIGDALWKVNKGLRPVRIVSAPYKFLPTASHLVATHLLRALSVRALSRGLEPPDLVPFHKARTGSSSYAKSSHAERQLSLKTLGLHLDESLIAGTDIIVVDDIRITGSAEHATAAYLEPLAPASVWYLHAARLSPEVAMAHPGLEDELNQTVPHTLDGFLEDMSAGQFKLNTRVLRLILETPDADTFRAFLRAVPYDLLNEMYFAAVGSGRSYFNKYSVNLDLFEAALALTALV
jgi:hypothetical protein